MTDTATQPEAHPYDDDVRRYLDLSETIEALNAERETVKNRLRDLGPGKHPSVNGVTVTVTPPSRRFNPDRAWTMLTPEQQTLCVSPDAKKIKAQLPGVLLDQAYDEGAGSPVVKIA